MPRNKNSCSAFLFFFWEFKKRKILNFAPTYSNKQCLSGLLKILSINSVLLDSKFV